VVIEREADRAEAPSLAKMGRYPTANDNAISDFALTG
jgi:hypothetical protein